MTVQHMILCVCVYLFHCRQHWRIYGFFGCFSSFDFFLSIMFQKVAYLNCIFGVELLKVLNASDFMPHSTHCCLCIRILCLVRVWEKTNCEIFFSASGKVGLYFLQHCDVLHFFTVLLLNCVWPKEMKNKL